MAGISFSSEEITVLKNKICWEIVSAANENSNPEGRNYFCCLFSTPFQVVPIYVHIYEYIHIYTQCLCIQCAYSSLLSIHPTTLQILTINEYKRESLHAHIHKRVRWKCSSPPDTTALSAGCCVHFSSVSTSSVWMSLSRLSSLHWTYA